VYGEKVFNIAAPRGIYSSTLAPFFEGRYVGRDTIGSGKIRGLMDLYSTPTTFGSSGSPIVNADGEVVGLVSMAIIGFENLGISPPYESLRDILLSVQEQ
jgi:S1-C subfamily serine protease